VLSRERLVNRFIEMVRIPSISFKEGEFSSYIKKEFERLNIRFKEDNAGKKIGSNANNLIGYLEGDGEPFFICAHMDTVTPGENINPIILDGNIITDGNTILGADDKAAISAILEAITALKEDNIKVKRAEIVFTIAEEVGLLGAKNLDFSLLNSKFGYVLDADGDLGTVITKAPYHSRFYINIYGKASHAGAEPEKGVNAILLASEFLLESRWGKLDEETTGNVGIIRGGRATNIIPDEVYLEGEFRSLDNNKVEACFDNLKNSLKKIELKQGKWELKREDLYKGYSIKDDEDVIKNINNVFKKLGIELKLKSTIGGSDANIFNEKGIKALNVGIAIENPHSVEEKVKIDNLFNLSKIVYELLKGE